MSYFLCGFKVNDSSFKAGEKALSEIVPVHLQADYLKTGVDSAHLAIYGNKKIIPNVIIHAAHSSSWLVIIGTPLVRFRSEGDKERFLTNFLTRPIETMRGDIDGNFAII